MCLAAQECTDRGLSKEFQHQCGPLGQARPTQWVQAVHLTDDEQWEGRQWKGVRVSRGAVQLYELSTDPTEQVDVAAANPQLAKRVARIMEDEHVEDENWPSSSSLEHPCCAACFDPRGCDWPCVRHPPPPPLPASVCVLPIPLLCESRCTHNLNRWPVKCVWKKCNGCAPCLQHVAEEASPSQPPQPQPADALPVQPFQPQAADARHPQPSHETQDADPNLVVWWVTPGSYIAGLLLLCAAMCVPRCVALGTDASRSSTRRMPCMTRLEDAANAEQEDDAHQGHVVGTARPHRGRAKGRARVRQDDEDGPLNIVEL